MEANKTLLIGCRDCAKIAKIIGISHAILSALTIFIRTRLKNRIEQPHCLSAVAASARLHAFESLVDAVVGAGV